MPDHRFVPAQDSAHSSARDDRAGDKAAAAARHLAESLENVREALQTIRYGSIALTIHEGRVVQIDVTEKRRFRPE
ncbi:MAG TPA: YezD family protein [Novosphingobium sp.]|nr:YezD family protein [Novosphingobium sp.]